MPATKHLQGLRAKMAARVGVKRKGTHPQRFPVPANHVRSTRAQRAEAHAYDMANRRQLQLAATAGFIPAEEWTKFHADRAR